MSNHIRDPEASEEGKMATVGILTDTTASIPRPLAEDLGIELVPYYVHRGLETLRDEVDIDTDMLARYLERADTLPTTSNPSPGDYTERSSTAGGADARNRRPDHDL